MIAYLKCTIDLKLTTTQSATPHDVTTTQINKARGNTNNTINKGITHENTKQWHTTSKGGVYNML